MSSTIFVFIYFFVNIILIFKSYRVKSRDNVGDKQNISLWCYSKEKTLDKKQLLDFLSYLMQNIDRFKNVNYCLVCGKGLRLKQDKENKLRPHCESCGWIYYKNHVPAVACVVLNEKNQLLLVKRKYEPQIGFWALPSGYMEIWQTPEETAIDELCEETGLIGEIESFIGYYSGYSPIYEKVLSLGFKMKVIGGTLQAGDDAIEAVYFDIDKIPEIAFWSHQDFIKKCGINLITDFNDCI